MSYLLDTHTFLWYASGAPELSETALNIIDSRHDKFVSIASLWEIAIKLNIGKLNINDDFDKFIKKQISINNYKILEIKLPHLSVLRNLTIYHRDPFDRIIISQSISESLTIVGKDVAFNNYNIDIIW